MNFLQVVLERLELIRSLGQALPGGQGLEKSRQELLGGVRHYQEDRGWRKSRQELLGGARHCQELPGGQGLEEV